ncbi:(2Fe-2S)-binding protein [Croceicoccus naphthovorans]|uniref:Ferredoxin n=1 Tax=Croceicoccus naphthovorans TaxID=1348774 RepID=A0A0G3XCD1_9SPHN|nr:(2Fe-2S)-binding protein [Croceicoccus naphthovorans]AKM09210.1 ferredoxin [Croceicoccus naphthovorans]MBB3990407.1 bacterioferritin-associated ferredoxin [Croceicoccus naphthovorans]
MYLCICNAIREKDFRALAPVCAGTAEHIYAELGHQPQCRQCLDEAEEILDEFRCCAA